MKVCAICGTQYEGDYCPECGNGQKNQKQKINYDIDIELAEQGLVPFVKKKKQITVWLLVFSIPIVILLLLLLLEKIIGTKFGVTFSFSVSLITVLTSFVGLIGLIIKLYSYKDLQPRGHLRAIKNCFAKIGIGTPVGDVFFIEELPMTDIGAGITLVLFFLPLALSYIIVVDSVFTLFPTIFQIFIFAKRENENNGTINLKKLKHSNRIITAISVICAVVFVIGCIALSSIADKNTSKNNNESSITINETGYDEEIVKDGVAYSLQGEETDSGETEYYYSVKAVDNEKEKLTGELAILADIDGLPVKNIEEKGFCGCTGITSVVIPDSVIRIGKAAFSGCNNLQSYTAPYVGLSAESEFEDAVLGSVFEWKVVVGNYASGSEKIAKNVGPNEIPEGATWQITVFKPNSGWDYYCYCIPSTLTTVSITKQNALPDYVFNGCDSLKTINLVSGSTLGEYALQNCNATVNQ